MTESGNDRFTVVSALRWAMLFGVGSVLVLREKTREFVEQAIEKGQEAEKEGKKLVQEMLAEKRQKDKEREDTLDARINAALERRNVPTETEIRELNQKIIELSEHIDELKAAS